MIVIELAELLVSCGFLYPRTPADPINRRLGYTVLGRIETGSNEMSTYGGVGVYEYKFSSSSASCPIPFMVENTLKDFRTGVLPRSVVLSLYTNLS